MEQVIREPWGVRSIRSPFWNLREEGRSYKKRGISSAPIIKAGYFVFFPNQIVQCCTCSSGPMKNITFAFL